MEKQRFLALFGAIMFMVCLAGCSGGDQESSGSTASATPSATSTLEPSSSPEASPLPSDATGEVEQVEYNGVTFELGTQYELRENDNGSLSIVFETGVATMTVHYQDSILSDRETEATLFNSAMLSGFSERQNEEQNTVDVNGVSSQAITCLLKGDNTPWLNAMCLTVPTETGYVSFLYLQALETESDYTTVFGELMESITVA